MNHEKERSRPLPPQGVYTATWIPYGYRYDPDSIAMVKIDTEVADHVRFIFRQYLDGVSLQQICKLLNEQGATNPALRRKQLGHSYRVSKGTDCWNAASLNQMLFNPMYAGDWVLSGRVWDAVYYYGDEPAPEGIDLPVIEENHHEALVSHEDMRKASSLYLKTRSGRHAKRRAVDNSTTDQTFYSLGYVLRCGECGRIMNKNEIFSGDGKSFIAYTCSSFTLQQASKCANRFYRMDEITAAVTPLLLAERKEAIKYRDMVGDEKNIQYIRVENYLQRQINQAVEAVRKNLSAARKLKSRLQSQKITEEGFHASQAQMEEENRAAEQQVMAALIRIRAFRSTCTVSNPWLSLYAGLPEEIDLTNDRSVVKQAIDHIDLFPDKPPAVSLARMEEKKKFLKMLYTPIRARHLTLDMEDEDTESMDSENDTEEIPDAKGETKP